jgi:hypothetical protein
MDADSQKYVFQVTVEMLKGAEIEPVKEYIKKLEAGDIYCFVPNRRWWFRPSKVTISRIATKRKPKK